MHSTITYNTDFPAMRSVDLHTYFQEQIVYFFFNLTKKEKTTKIDELSNQLFMVLQLLKKEISNNENKSLGNDWLRYLELFYRMIGQTRDIFGGKGEHAISYMLILTFYDIFPSLAIYALHRFVLPIPSGFSKNIDDKYNVTYGSWRDMKYFCEYARNNSPRGEEHELIYICIKLMNTQLKKDVESWKFSIHARSREHISNVAKWIPRENTQFHWLYEKMVIHWTNTHFPYILENSANSYDSALLKCKRMYRKTISSLNKALDTTEIKQCSRNISEIKPTHVSTYTMMKQKRLIFGDENDDDYNECAQHFKTHFDKLFTSPAVSSGHGSLFFTVSYFVKEAIRLSAVFNEINKVENSNKTYVCHQMDVLNNLWYRFSMSIKNINLENMIPALNVSHSIQKTDAESYYNAIGIAILIAERSSFGKRILAIDQQYTWISLEIDNFISNVENIVNSSKSMQNTTFHLNNAMNFFMFSIKQTNMSDAFIKNMSVIILTDFAESNSTNYSTVPSISFDPDSTDADFYPNIVLWNLSKNNNIDLPCSIHNNNVLLLSGFSNCLHSYFSSLKYFNKNRLQTYWNSSDPPISTNSYQFIVHILENPRYHLLSNYLYRIIQK